MGCSQQSSEREHITITHLALCFLQWSKVSWSCLIMPYQSPHITLHQVSPGHHVMVTRNSNQASEVIEFEEYFFGSRDEPQSCGLHIHHPAITATSLPMCLNIHQPLTPRLSSIKRLIRSSMFSPCSRHPNHWRFPTMTDMQPWLTCT